MISAIRFQEQGGVETHASVNVLSIFNDLNSSCLAELTSMFVNNLISTGKPVACCRSDVHMHVYSSNVCVICASVIESCKVVLAKVQRARDRRGC
jgi:hypothetical protein